LTRSSLRPMNPLGYIETKSIDNADNLAALLAVKARVLSDAIRNALTDNAPDYDNRSLQEQLEAFQKVLIPDIDIPTFSDVYAQTLAYGMFVARYHHKNGKAFTRQTAVESIPKSHPFLRKLFGYVAGVEIDERIKWVIDELADLLYAANLKVIMEDFGKNTQTEDPTIHFYENFLTAYNPLVRKSRGVYYTPLPVVQYIVRTVDEILKNDFNLSNGIADNTKTDLYTKTGEPIHKIQILDPATGTGTFLAETVRYIHASIVSQGQQGGWNNYVANDLLPRLHGFEILMAPYAMAHLKLDTILEQSGFNFINDQRIGIYLTNSLEEGSKKIDRLPFAMWLSDEAEGANKVKTETPVMVVFGNPPYNVSTMNKNKFSEQLIEKYKAGEGIENEANIQPLSDDYIKFIALGQRFIETNPSSCGILAYVSNNSFLDGLIHRQMRKCLLETFDKIYILNLHGNSRIKEKTPNGDTDESVFKIQVGTSINLFIRNPKKRKGLAKVYYTDIYGKRQDKYNFLLLHNLKKTGYVQLEPVEPYYFFTPKDFSSQKKYEKGFSVTELFITGNSGVETKRDSLFIDDKKDVLIKRIKTLLSSRYDERFAEEYRVTDTNGYEITRLIKGKQFSYNNLHRIDYRPFDTKWIYYDPTLIARHFFPTMRHLLDKENFGLIVKRGFNEPNSSPAFVSKHIIDRRTWTRPGMQGAEQIFPLYIYPLGERQPNLNQEIVTKIETITSKKVKPEKLFDYVYAVLHSPKYRETYQEFLKIDFPRIPYPKDNTEFERFAKFGQRLRELHLLEKIPKTKTMFSITGSDTVDSIRYTNERVYINAAQYFDSVPESAWNFYIGGYQPAQKYLKDRKGRELSFEEIAHYQNIIAILIETEKTMKEIDYL
jgi:predicted helicase